VIEQVQIWNSGWRARTKLANQIVVRRSWLRGFGCILVVSLGVIWLARSYRQSNPLFQGRSAPAWAHGLNSADPKVRARSAEAIQSMGPEAVAPLASALSRKEWLLKKIPQKLGIKPPAALRRLYHQVFNPADAVMIRADAARALTLLAPEAERAIPALGRALEDENPTVSVRAAEALARIGKPAIRTLIKVLEEGGITARSSATYAIGVIGPEAKAAIPALTENLKHGPTYDAKQPAYALGRIGPAATPTLIQLLRENDGSLRFLAAYAFNVMGPLGKEALPALLSALEDSEAMVRRQAAESLMNIAPADRRVIDAFIRSIPDAEENVRSAVLQALSRVAYATESAVPLLMERLTDDSPAVRRWTAILLGRIGSAAKPAVPALCEALKDTDEQARIEAKEALRKIDPALLDGPQGSVPSFYNVRF
jgi:HEAT repeat protein